MWVISHSSQITSFYCLARYCKTEKMPVHIAVSCTVKSSSPWIFYYFFLNLWFQSFLLNHLTLCLMTSFLCPSPLMSREHLRKMITTEKMQRFRKRQAEHLHSEVYLRQSHGWNSSETSLTRSWGHCQIWFCLTEI